MRTLLKVMAAAGVTTCWLSLPILAQDRTETWIDDAGNTFNLNYYNQASDIRCEGMMPGGSATISGITDNSVYAELLCSDLKSSLNGYFCRLNEAPNVRPWARRCAKSGWSLKD